MNSYWTLYICENKAYILLYEHCQSQFWKPNTNFFGLRDIVRFSSWIPLWIDFSHNFLFWPDSCQILEAKYEFPVCHHCQNHYKPNEQDNFLYISNILKAKIQGVWTLSVKGNWTFLDISECHKWINLGSN